MERASPSCPWCNARVPLTKSGARSPDAEEWLAAHVDDHIYDFEQTDGVVEGRHGEVVLTLGDVRPDGGPLPRRSLMWLRDAAAALAPSFFSPSYVERLRGCENPSFVLYATDIYITELVGYAFFSHRSAAYIGEPYVAEIHLDQLAVAPEHQLCGIGGALLDYLLDTCELANLVITAWVVSSQLPFFDQWNFEAIDPPVGESHLLSEGQTYVALYLVGAAGPGEDRGGRGRC